MSLKGCPDPLSVMEGLLNLVEEEHRSKGRLSPEVFHALHTVHGQSLLNALDLIDNKKITKLVSASGRVIIRVTGSLGTPYFCFLNSVSCQCPSYKYCVIKRKENIMCKHVLAACLATAMEITEVVNVSDDYLLDILMNLTMCEI